MNFIDNEFTQCRVFFDVNLSPSNTCPRWASHLAQRISTRRPSASSTRFTAPGISSSKLGQPQCDSNLSFERYNGASHLLQMYVPSSLLLSSSPVKGLSVPLCTIMYSSSGVSLLYFVVSFIVIKVNVCLLSVCDTDVRLQAYIVAANSNKSTR